MTQIYLDLDNVVRVDTSTDARHARAANFDRGLLEMGGLLQRLGVATARVRRLRGLDAAGCLADLNEIDEIKADIRSRAKQRVDQY